MRWNNLNIGHNYAENKVYRGIRTSNGLPYLAEDFHEVFDTIANKNSYVFGSILGSGILKDIEISISSAGIKLINPAILNIEGDICLVKNSDSLYFSSKEELTSTKSTIYVVGWYQHITASTTMRDYGGVRNESLPNDLIYEPLGIQVSSRYQFRWDTVILPNDLVELPSTLEIPARDANGELTGGNYTLRNISRKDSLYIADPPVNMDYAIDKVYIIPLIECNLSSNGSILSAKSVSVLKTNSSGSVSVDDSEPTDDLHTGDMWYDKSAEELKIYIEGLGFLSSAPKFGFLQYQCVDISQVDILEPRDITVQLDLPALLDTDILRVTYEGLELLEGTDYTINRQSLTLTLLNFTRMVGERLTVSMMRLVKSSEVASLATSVSTHVSSSGTQSSPGHLRLTDSIAGAEDVTAGVAVTPKAVQDALLLTDTSTGTKYKLVVTNGNLTIQPV